MLAKKPPRDYTQAQFYAWVDAAERAVADRYAFRPATPLRDNAMFLYLIHRAARGQVSGGGVELFITRAMAVFFAATGFGCGDMLSRHLGHRFFGEIATAGPSSRDLADGLLGYLLVPTGPTGALFRSKTSLWVNLMWAGIAAYWFYGVALTRHAITPFAPALAPWLATLLLPMAILWLAWRAAFAPLLANGMADIERWVAAVTPLSSIAARRIFWAERGARSASWRASFTLVPIWCFRLWWSRARALDVVTSVANRLLCFAIAWQVARALIWDQPFWGGLGPFASAAWGWLPLLVVWLPLALLEERRFNRVAKPDELLVEAAEAWRLSALDRHEARETA